MMVCSIDLTLSNLAFLGAIVFALVELYEVFRRWSLAKKLEKWSENCPKDKVLLHTLWKCRTMPCISPFGFKLETYLRLAKIPYQIDTVDSTGPYGKMPWITYNGMHIPDSHFCIQFLNKKFGINLNNGKSEETLAIARSCRILLEEHFVWGMIQYRIKDNVNNMPEIVKMPKFLQYLLPTMTLRATRHLNAQGLGLHSNAEIYELTENDLKTVSALLGNKKFFGGDSPCDDDCAIFGCVGQAVWAMPGSSYERLVNGELSNLKNYCERMKELAWPDWEKCIDK